MEMSLDSIAEAFADSDTTELWEEHGSVFLLVSLSRLTKFEGMDSLVDAIKRVHACNLLTLGVIDELHMYAFTAMAFALELETCMYVLFG